MQTDRGTTLVIALVYIALLALVVSLLTRMAANLIHLNAEAKLTGEVIDNAQRALAILTQEIKRADSVYVPTSTFGTTPGQLSLATTHNLPSDETITYLDFYVDDQHLYLKREGQPPALLTSERVKVTNLQFTHLYPTSTYTAIRIAATFATDSPGSEAPPQTAISLTSTVALRNY